MISNMAILLRHTRPTTNRINTILNRTRHIIRNNGIRNSHILRSLTTRVRGITNNTLPYLLHNSMHP
jgi:hypothetical protein